MRRNISKLMSIAAAVLICGVLGPAAKAQRGSVAICPAVFDNRAGTAEAQAEAISAIRSTLEQAGFTVSDYDSGKSKWIDLGFTMPTKGQAPASRDLTRFGQAVGADYVLVPEFDFNANRTWNVGGKYTTVKAVMHIYNTSDPSFEYDRTETISKTTLSPGGFSTLSRSDREKRVVDQAVDVTLAGFTRLMKLILH